MKSKNPAIQKTIDYLQNLLQAEGGDIKYEITALDSQALWTGISELTSLAYRKIQEANLPAGTVYERKFIMKCTTAKGDKYCEVELDIEGILGPLSETETEKYIPVSLAKQWIQEEVSKQSKPWWKQWK